MTRVLAQLAHQGTLFLDQRQFAPVDHADAIGHFLRLFDIMGREYDRDALFAQPADHSPHVAPQFDVDARRGFVEEQDARLVRERLGDQDAAFHPA